MLNRQEKIAIHFQLVNVKWSLIGSLVLIMLFWGGKSDAYQEMTNDLLDQLNGEAINTDLRDQKQLVAESNSPANTSFDSTGFNGNIDMQAVIDRVRLQLLNENNEEKGINSPDLELLVRHALSDINENESLKEGRQQQNSLSQEMLQANISTIINEVLTQFDLGTQDQSQSVLKRLEQEAKKSSDSIVSSPSIDGYLIKEKGCSFDDKMMSAVKDNTTDYIQSCLDKGFLINQPNRHSGITLLHLAASQGLLSMADFLLENRADINAQENKNRTPLFYAVATQQSAMVKWLLSKGADKAIRDSLGATPLTRATNTELRRLLHFGPIISPNN